MVTPVSPGAVAEIPGRRVTELLRSFPDVASAVRHRVALDVIAELLRSGSRRVEPRRSASRLHLAGVEVTLSGVSRVVAVGDDSGALELVSEIVVSPDADVRAFVDGLSESAVRLGGLEALFDLIARRGAGALASHDEVRRAFDLGWPVDTGMSSSALPLATGSFASAAQRLASRSPATQDRQSAAWHSLVQEEVTRRRKSPAPPEPRATALRLTPQLAPREPVASAPPPRWSSAGPPPSPRWTEPPATQPVKRPVVMIVAGVDLERRCLAAALRDAGHRVVELNDADAAIAAATTQPPLAIIADSDVRGRTSEELIRRIRGQSGAVAATPVLQLVLPTATRVIKTTFATSADVRVIKPVRADDLVAELGRLLIMGPRLRVAREGFAKLEGSTDSILRGDLGTVPIEGLLTMLELERRTGFVRISTPRGTVGLELASGAVARGSFGGEMVPALDAMRRLAGIDDGPFSFHALPPRAAPPEAQPLHVLLRASLQMGRRSGDEQAASGGAPRRD